MPTAFLYGSLFAVVWFGLQGRLGTRTASTAGLAFVAIVVLGVPVLSNFATSRMIEDAQRLDREPGGGPASPSGTLRIEQERLGHPGGIIPQTTRDDRSTYGCDDLCAAALFTPGITAVTMAAPVGGDSRPWVQPDPDFTVTYRLAPRVGADCPDPKLPGEGSELGSWPEIEGLRTAWKFALSGGTCLVRDLSPAPPVSDWTLSIETEKSGGNLGSPLELARLVVANRAGEVVRRTAVTARLVSDILWIEPRGGLTQPAWYGWARRSVTKGAFAPIDSLKRTTTLGLTTATSTAGVPHGEELRARLAIAFADPTLPADAVVFSLVKLYLQELGAKEGKPAMREGDVALLMHLIADPRVRQFAGIEDAIKALGPDASSLRGPMVARLLKANGPGDVAFAKTLGAALSNLPPSTFATTTPDETRLLADDQRRRWATGLVVRQSDRGAAAAPDLVHIIAQAYARQNSDSLDDAFAAVKALCLLGRGAAGVLPDLEALIETDVVPRSMMKSDPWKVMLTRLGKPIESVAKPANVSDTQNHFAVPPEHRLPDVKPGPGKLLEEHFELSQGISLFGANLGGGNLKESPSFTPASCL